MSEEIKCLRCGRDGHLAEDCKLPVLADGREIGPATKPLSPQMPWLGAHVAALEAEIKRLSKALEQLPLLSDAEIDAALPHEPGDLDLVCARAIEEAVRAKLCALVAPSAYVNAANINANDMPGTVVKKLDAAFHAKHDIAGKGGGNV